MPFAQTADASVTFASPETYTATDFSAVTLAPLRAVKSPPMRVEASVPTTTPPFAATSALSTVTSPAASMSTSPFARAFAPPWTATDEPAPVASSFSVPSAPALAASTVTPDFAVSVRSLPASTFVAEPETATEPFSDEIVTASPTPELRPATYAPFWIATLPSPVFASTVRPLSATSVAPSTLTPTLSVVPSSPLAVTVALPDAPTSATFCTVTSLPAVTVRSALSVGAIVGAVPGVVGMANVPALTTALASVAVPMLTRPAASSVTPVPPITCVFTVMSLSAPVVLTLAVVAASIPLICVEASVWSMSVTSSVAVGVGHLTSVTFRSSSAAVADLTVMLPVDSTSTFPPVDLYATSTSFVNLNLMSAPETDAIPSTLTDENSTPVASFV